MKLSIITINYNGSEKTLKLLKSLSEQTDKDFETIVIDNASDEVDFHKLKEGIGGAFLIRNEKNLGFSGGNNVGIQEALNPPAGGGFLKEASGQADWVLLLNNDTWLASGFTASLKLKLKDLRGIVGVPLDEGEHTAYCGKVEWLKGTLKHIYNPIYAESLVRNSNYYAIGGAMAIHKYVFNRIGFLDEKYFLYFEDAALSIRAKRVGLKLTFLEEPKAHHQVSSTTKKLGSPLLLRYHYRNALYFNLKNGPWYIKLAVWPWSLWIIAKQVSKIMIYHKRDQSSAILRGVFDFYKNKMGEIK